MIDLWAYSNMFCQAKMAMEVEVVKFGWDMSLKAQSRRYLAMNSLWLYDEYEGMNEGNMFGSNNPNWCMGEREGEEGRNLALVLIPCWE